MANSQCRWEAPGQWDEWSEWLAAGLPYSCIEIEYDGPPRPSFQG